MIRKRAGAPPSCHSTDTCTSILTWVGAARIHILEEKKQLLFSSKFLHALLIQKIENFTLSTFEK
jgi:hypothetical protein